MIQSASAKKGLLVGVVRKGGYGLTQRPSGRTTSLRYRDMSPEPGETYYYVRLFQRDPDDPAGDPEIAWRRRSS